MIHKPSKIYRDAILSLYQGSTRAIPFNILVASLLLFDLIYNQVPLFLLGIWFLAIVLISVLRWFFCFLCLKKKYFERKMHQGLHLFTILTLLMGTVWGSCYLIALPHLSELHEFIIILVLGGMCAGSIASLSIYLPVYYAYILPMFIPVIVYNYSVMNFDRAVLATMFLLFVIMVIVSALLNNRLLNTTLKLFQEKESLISQLKTMSLTDSLTGLYNRRHFEAVLNSEFYRAKRNNYPLNLVLIDIDNFKVINDSFGHPHGDIILINLADVLIKSLQRASEIVFRLGGDEFAIIFINNSIENSLSICNVIKNNFRNNLLSYDKAIFNQPELLNKITLSMGLVHLSWEENFDLQQVISLVDKALYQAKNHGKNKIVIKEIG
ncbi:GGDEF domain-containing protein [Legionella antarctica]|uniref:diguanylate cyclase n=1 Tax=Legionella antarctica TaxID=2708020 RepID=A0A6F8T9Q3_9GAMM|nr:GGDEF domain-containing protein [Legionella antarctica]BCA96890.1 GGDEF domain-containing protein [Legionella antarctica]